VVGQLDALPQLTKSSQRANALQDENQPQQPQAYYVSADIDTLPKISKAVLIASADGSATQGYVDIFVAFLVGGEAFAFDCDAAIWGTRPASSAAGPS
jgi:hypothetical protein